MKKKVSTTDIEERNLPDSYVSQNRQVNVMDVIQVHCMFEGEETKGWVHTHGMSQFGLPELEMRKVPLFLAAHACSLINEVCHYMLNSDDKVLKPGQGYQFGPATFILDRSTPIPGHEHHYSADRWLFREIQPKCEKCEGHGEGHARHNEADLLH